MRRSLLLALLPGAVACTSTPSEPRDSDIDQSRMSTIDRAASDRGVKVYWFNPPRKTQGPEATKQGG